MHTRSAHNILVACAVFLLCSCKDRPSGNHGPIVLGDSSTIVTENDPQKLKDLVTELHPDITPSAEKDTAVAAKDTVRQVAHTDTMKKAVVMPPAPQPEVATSGLKADFGATTVLVGNVHAKLSGNPDLKRASGAVYTLTGGTINGNILKVTGNVTKVSQRYQTVVVLKNSATNLPIDALSNTTDWEVLKGGNNMYRITGLDAASLDYTDAGPAAIRSAVSKAAKRHRMNRKSAQELESSIRNVRRANQKPLYVMLRSVMWKIDGKDEKGRPFSKQIRIDTPM